MYALNVTSDSDARTREVLAPAAPVLAALNATLGRPTEARIEGEWRLCASAWVPEGCEPGPQGTTRAPWETEPNAPSVTMRPPDACQPVVV